jgi:hypothetical protein
VAWSYRRQRHAADYIVHEALDIVPPERDDGYLRPNKEMPCRAIQSDPRSALTPADYAAATRLIRKAQARENFRF